MNTQATRSLRSTLAAITIVVAALAAMVAALLVLFTSWLSSAPAAVVTAQEAVRLAEEEQIALLAHARADDPAVRRGLEVELGAKLARAEALITTPDERTAWDRARRAMGDYRVAVKTSQGEPERLSDAIDALGTFASLNLAESQAAHRHAERLNRVANAVGGIALALTLLIGPAGAWWLRTRAFRPMLELTDAIARFAGGDRDARAPERGPVELLEAAQRFNGMAAELSRRREMQMAFLAGIAHDLRTPLHALQMAVETLRLFGAASDREPGRAETISLARRQIERLDRMIGDFLSTALTEAGQLSLKIEPHDLRQIASDSLDLFRASLPAHDLVLSVPDEPAVAPCDAARVEQVMNNLISNAAKYSPGGGRIVTTVAVTRSAVSFSVADEGLGIAAAEQQRVFEPFRRGSAASNSSIPGTGLGLFVAKRIVEAHRGSIHLSSAPGRGSTLTVRLPRAAC